MTHLAARDPVPASRILRRGARSGRLMHVEEIPARPGAGVPWPDWVPAEITQALSRAGVTRPWAHQAAMAEHARHGRNVIIATPAASGKSLGYLLPALTAVLSGSTVLYLAPTRALAADQVRAVRALDIPGVCAAVVDGDTLSADRERARTRANYLLTTPDMLHHVLLPRHSRWGELFGRLEYVIVDECHGYSGVFGSHVAHVLRRLRRVAAHHARRHPARARAGASPASLVFLLASATVSEPGVCARLLTGADAEEITESAAPRGPVTFGLWEPPLTAARGESGAPVRPATAEAASLLADLVAHDVRGLAFTRSRRGAEAVAIAAKRALSGRSRPRYGASRAAAPGTHPGLLEETQTLLQRTGDFRQIDGPLDPNGITTASTALAAAHATLSGRGPAAALPLQEPSGIDLSAADYDAYRDTARWISPDGRTIQFETELVAGRAHSPVAASAIPDVRVAVADVGRSIGATASGINGYAATAADVSKISTDDLMRIIPIVLLVLGLLLAIRCAAWWPRSTWWPAWGSRTWPHWGSACWSSRSSATRTASTSYSRSSCSSSSWPSARTTTSWS